MHIPRALCAKDNREMVIVQTGVYVEMHAEWGPYYKVSGDAFQCTICGHKVILLAQAPIAESYQVEYAQVHATVMADFAAGSIRNGEDNGGY